MTRLKLYYSQWGNGSLGTITAALSRQRLFPGDGPALPTIGRDPSGQEYKSEALEGGLPRQKPPRLTMQHQSRLWPLLAAVGSSKTNHHILWLASAQSHSECEADHQLFA